MKNYILVKDMTKLFNKEMLLYSMFDLSFKKPIRVVFLVYLILLLGIWTAPLTYFLWPLGPYKAMFIFGPPFLMANLMSKPIWGGKSFFSWFKCQLRFAFSKKRYYDGYGKRNLNVKYTVNHTYTVSRRKDFIELFNQIQREKAEEKQRKTSILGF